MQGGSGGSRRDGRVRRAESSLPGLAWMLREPLSDSSNLFTRRRPVRIARITVEHQSIGFQRFFEIFLVEPNCLVVVVRTDGLEIKVVAHEPPVACGFSDLPTS